MNQRLLWVVLKTKSGHLCIHNLNVQLIETTNSQKPAMISVFLEIEFLLNIQMVKINFPILTPF